MLHNPFYAGTAVFGKTQAVHKATTKLNRTAHLAGRTVPRQIRVQDRPREEWTGIPVPALVDEETFDRVQQRLADNKRFASRNTKVPSLLQGIAACASCGYGYYRTTTTTTAGNKIYYYRYLGSDDYHYQGGQVLQLTGPSAPTTPTRSSGTTSRPCSPTPPSSAPPRSARGWKGHGHLNRSPASAASSSRPSPTDQRCRSTR